MSTDLVIVTVGAHDARIAAYPADSAGARCELLGQATGLAAAATRARRRERRHRLAPRGADDRRQQLAQALMGVG
ncbi:MAG TPA: hypothetical protein VHJ18_01845 [Streptosporangiaceae bacterium]|nr:hypothetical protein [Streptosporangiaceae bacterium]